MLSCYTLVGYFSLLRVICSTTIYKARRSMQPCKSSSALRLNKARVRWFVTRDQAVAQLRSSMIPCMGRLLCGYMHTCDPC
ncbi:hypothetical protein F4860DRAFT_448173 [Xylaria cubensis]|nr:hypothetical protein F4860DRAFT_448173 [Xylaria cubensis]